MTLNELNTTNRNLFPSSGLDKSTASAPSGQIETDLEKMKTASSSLRFSVQNRLNQKNTVDSQIRNVYQIVQPFYDWRTEKIFSLFFIIVESTKSVSERP